MYSAIALSDLFSMRRSALLAHLELVALHRACLLQIFPLILVTGGRREQKCSSTVVRPRAAEVALAAINVFRGMKVLDAVAVRVDTCM